MHATGAAGNIFDTAVDEFVPNLSTEQKLLEYSSTPGYVLSNAMNAGAVGAGAQEHSAAGQRKRDLHQCEGGQ